MLFRPPNMKGDNYCCLKTNDVNRYANNGGGSSTMMRKAGTKYNRLSSHNKNFSLNGANNSNLRSYIGNPLSQYSIDPDSCLKNGTCNTYNPGYKTSVKNYSAMYRTRSRNNTSTETVCNNVNSFDCFKKANPSLVELAENNTPINKIFNANNKDQSTRTQILKARCRLDRSNYNDKIKELDKSCIADNTSKKVNYNDDTRFKKCNITKDNNMIKGYTPAYDIFYNDSTLFKKKCINKQTQPPDAKVIAC